MKYAINNWVYNDEPLRDTFARLAKYGYDGVELKGEVQQYDVAEVKALCREFNLKVTSVLGWNIYPIPGATWLRLMRPSAGQPCAMGQSASISPTR